MKFRLTVESITLAGLVCAAITIGGASYVAINSADRLIDSNETLLDAQRVIAALEDIRYSAMEMDVGSRNYAITGKRYDFTPYLKGRVNIEAELGYLRARRTTDPILDRRFDELESAAQRLFELGKVETSGEGPSDIDSARLLVEREKHESEHDRVTTLIYKMLYEEHAELDRLEVAQRDLGTQTRQLILALVFAAGTILVFLYGLLHRLNAVQRVRQAHIAYEASHDALTGIMNRAAMMRELRANIDAATEGPAPFALLLLDLDGFKDVNDKSGHDAGDELLKEVALRIKGVLRPSDALARLGGDEFLAIVTGTDDRQSIAHVAQKMVEAVARPFHVGAGGSASVTVSIGISLCPGDQSDREKLMKAADLALYSAKHAGKNRYAFFAEN